jgi:hypothetical protein
VERRVSIPIERPRRACAGDRPSSRLRGQNNDFRLRLRLPSRPDQTTTHHTRNTSTEVHKPKSNLDRESVETVRYHTDDDAIPLLPCFAPNPLPAIIGSRPQFPPTRPNPTPTLFSSSSSSPELELRRAARPPSGSWGQTTTSQPTTPTHPHQPLPPGGRELHIARDLSSWWEPNLSLPAASH